MLNFNVPLLWRVVSTSVATIKSLTHLCFRSARKVELDRLVHLEETNQSMVDVAAEHQENNNDLMQNFAQSLLFGYSAYRVLNGEEDFSDWLVAGAATAYSLYEPAKQIANQVIESETAQKLSAKVLKRY